VDEEDDDYADEEFEEEDEQNEEIEGNEEDDDGQGNEDKEGYDQGNGDKEECGQGNEDKEEYGHGNGDNEADEDVHNNEIKDDEDVQNEEDKEEEIIFQSKEEEEEESLIFPPLAPRGSVASTNLTGTISPLGSLAEVGFPEIQEESLVVLPEITVEGKNIVSSKEDFELSGEVEERRDSVEAEAGRAEQAVGFLIKNPGRRRSVLAGILRRLSNLYCFC